MADKRLEKFAANGLWDAATIVRQPDLQSPGNFAQVDVDSPALSGSRNRLARIQQQVVKGALQLLSIEPADAVAFLPHRNAHRVKPRMSTYRLHHTIDRLPHAAVRPPQGLPGSRELE